MSGLRPPLAALVPLCLLAAACGRDAKPPPPPPSGNAPRAAVTAREDYVPACDYHDAAPVEMREPVTFYDGCPLRLPSPDRRFELTSEESGARTALSVLPGSGRRQLIGRYEPPVSVAWSAASDAFLINDQRGSGESSYLSVARLAHGRFIVSAGVRRSVGRLFRRRFRCRFGDEWVMTSGNWHDAKTVAVSAQANLHSGGCPLDRYASKKIIVLANARTGEVLGSVPGPGGGKRGGGRRP
ncbi:MAG TPA: hypothetical protein VGD66_05995 [Allosphingosinicella sp.]|jgi:hypothetical protein